MKTLRLFIMSAVVLIMTASCLKEGHPYSSGFIFRKPASPISAVFANNVRDTISVYSSGGSWTASSDAPSTGWCTLSSMQGKAGVLTDILVSFKQNTTGEPRIAQFNFVDAEHPDQGYETLVYWQYATRGDGSLGLARDVKTIVGTDGSRFELSYDGQHRATELTITRDGSPLRHLVLRYDDVDSTLTVTDGSETLRGSFSIDYQPMKLIGSTDTIGYYPQYYNYMAMPADYAFNLEHRTYGGENTIYAYLMGGQNVSPDSLHNADSLRIATTDGIDKYKLSYQKIDNRHQSVDVNQLVFGVEKCDPYQLLSLFRYARNTSVFSEVMDKKNGYKVEVALNADGSVHQLVVKTVSDGEVLPDIPLTYTFEY